MSTFTLLDIQNKIDEKINTLYNIPHNTIYNENNTLYGIISENIYPMGYFIPKFKSHYHSHTLIMRNGDRSFDIYERIGTSGDDSPTDIYSQTNGYMDFNGYKLSLTNSPYLSVGNYKNNPIGSRTTFQYILMDNFNYNDYNIPYAYFGMGGLSSTGYENFFICRYRKSTKKIDKVLFILSKSFTQYLLDFEHNDWEIVNPDGTNYFFYDLTGIEIDTQGLISMSISFDGVRRGIDLTSTDYKILDTSINKKIRFVVNGVEVGERTLSNYGDNPSDITRIGMGLRLNITPINLETDEPKLKILNQTSQRITYGISE
jgi:hypothetical protein